MWNMIRWSVLWRKVIQEKRWREENSRHRESPVQRPRKANPSKCPRNHSRAWTRWTWRGSRGGRCRINLEDFKRFWLFSEWHEKSRPASHSSGARERGQMKVHSHTLDPTSWPSLKLRGVRGSCILYPRDDRQSSSLGLFGQRIPIQGTQRTVIMGVGEGRGEERLCVVTFFGPLKIAVNQNLRVEGSLNLWGPGHKL